MSPQNLLVITHRRSGTHLTIDAIRNNFRRLRQQEYLVLETIKTSHPAHIPLETFSHRVQAGDRVVKTHYGIEDLDHLPEDERNLFQELLNSSQLIYVVRNGLDVMASLYEFRRGHDESVQGVSFSDFIRQPSFDPNFQHLNRIQYWRAHVLGWLNSSYRDRLLVLQFRNWIDDYRGTLKKIANHLGTGSDWRAKDVRMGSNKTKQKKLERTWVEPRKGTVGDFVNYFTPDDIDYFWSECGDVMNQLGYPKERVQVA